MGLAGCCLGNGNRGAPLLHPGHGLSAGTPSVPSLAPGSWPVLWSTPVLGVPFLFPDFFNLTDHCFRLCLQFPADASRLEVFLGMREKRRRKHKSCPRSPNKEHLLYPSSKLHAMRPSPGHYSELVSATPLEFSHASCGIMPTVWHCPAKGSCLPQLWLPENSSIR